jgi:hypothetical protein
MRQWYIHVPAPCPMNSSETPCAGRKKARQAATGAEVVPLSEARRYGTGSPNVRLTSSNRTVPPGLP